MFIEQIVSVLKFIFEFADTLRPRHAWVLQNRNILDNVLHFNAAGFKEFYKEAIYVEV